MRVLRLHGEAANIDVARWAHVDPRLTRLRDRLAERPGGSRARAQAIVEDMLVAAMHKMGDHIITVKGKLIDDVVATRLKLDGLLHEVLHGPSGKRTKADLERDLHDIEALYRDLDSQMKMLSQPLHEEIPPPDAANDVAAQVRREIQATPPSKPRQPERSVEQDFAVEAGKRQSRAARKGLKRQPNGSYRVRFADGSSAEFRVENGRYKLRTLDRAGTVTAEFGEFDILVGPYAGRPKTTSLMNAHHGMQNSLMKSVFGPFGYNGDAVPTIWLRDGRSGSPHGSVTAVQNGAKAARNRRGITLSDIRQWCIADLKGINPPPSAIDAYLAAFDAHFRKTVLPNLPKDQHWRLGDWKP